MNGTRSKQPRASAAVLSTKDAAYRSPACERHPATRPRLPHGEPHTVNTRFRSTKGAVYRGPGQRPGYSIIKPGKQTQRLATPRQVPAASALRSAARLSPR